MLFGLRSTLRAAEPYPLGLAPLSWSCGNPCYVAIVSVAVASPLQGQSARLVPTARNPGRGGALAGPERQEGPPPAPPATPSVGHASSRGCAVPADAQGTGSCVGRGGALRRVEQGLALGGAGLCPGPCVDGAGPVRKAGQGGSNLPRFESSRRCARTFRDASGPAIPALLPSSGPWRRWRILTAGSWS